MLGYKQGDRITIGGWIGETTTCLLYTSIRGCIF